MDFIISNIYSLPLDYIPKQIEIDLRLYENCLNDVEAGFALWKKKILSKFPNPEDFIKLQLASMDALKSRWIEWLNDQPREEKIVALNEKKIERCYAMIDQMAKIIFGKDPPSHEEKLRGFFPPEQQKEKNFCDLIIFFNDCYSDVRVQILNEIQKMSKEHISLEYIEPLIYFIKFSDEYPNLLEVLHNLPQSGKLEYLRLNNLLFTSVIYSFDSSYVVRLCSKIPKEEIHQALSEIVSFLNEIPNGFLHSEKIVMAFAAIPPDEMSLENLRVVINLMKECKQLFFTHPGAFKTLEENVQQSGFVTQFKQLAATKAAKADMKGFIYHQLVSFPHSQRMSMVKLMVPFLDNFNYETICHRLFSFLRSDDIASRIHLGTMSKVFPLLKDINDGHLIIVILKLLGDLQSHLVDENVFDWAIQFLKPLSEEQRNQIESSCQWMSPSERTKGLEILRLYPELLPIINGSMLAALVEIDSEKLRLLIPMTKPIFQDQQIMADADVYLIADLFNILPLFPDNQLNEELARSIIPSLKTLYSNEKRREFAQTLQLITPEKRAHALEILKQNQTFINDLNTLQNLFLYSQEIRIASQDYLFMKLEKLLSNREEASLLSHTLIIRARELLLHDEHPLYQRAIEVAAISDASLLDNKKNPYTLFQKLKASIHTETKCTVGSQLNLETLRKRGAYKGFTVKDLPSGISEGTLLNLFDNLERRLKALSFERSLATEVYIRDSFGKPIKKLKSNIFGKTLIPGLLKVPSSLDYPIEAATFYLYTLIKVILESSPILDENMFLSPQEELLLRITCSINNCVTGQRDGIVLYYNHLPPKYRTREVCTLVQEKIAYYVDQSVQKVLHEIFASEELLHEILGSQMPEIISQHAHQTHYLKNRLFLQVGLSHCLSFDPHTYVILDALVDADIEVLLKAFFKLFTKEKVVAKLKRDMSEALKEKTMYPSLQEFLEPHFKVSDMYESWYNICFALDVDDFNLTEEGTHKLLEIVGYL